MQYVKTAISVSIFLLVYIFTNAQVSVTYKVDIQNYLRAGNVLGANGIRIAGNFSDLGANLPNWTPSSPACAMIRQGTSNVWSITVTYPSTAIGQTQIYKFVNNDWGTNEGVDFSNQLVANGCGINDGTGNINRVLVIPNSASSEVSFCWDQCSVCNTSPNGLPYVTTSAVNNINQTTATCGGYFVGATIAHGICYSTFPNPTTSNFYYNTTTTQTVFDISGLQPNTTYYVRAYAANVIGTAYGNSTSFKTLALPPIINNFNPKSGNPGSAVTISGSNFNPIATNNVVYFGATKATVISASSTSLTVLVPSDATYSSLAVIDIITNQTGLSMGKFLPIFYPQTQNFGLADFVPKVDFAISPQYGNVSTSITIGDFDGDGKTDILVPADGGFPQSRNSLYVFRNTSIIGNLTFAPKFEGFVGQCPSSLSVVDIDGDGKNDLVSQNSDRGVLIFKNNSIIGNIIFNTPVNTGISGTSYVAVGDIDGDGKQDLVTMGNSKISVFRNTSLYGVVSFETEVFFSLTTDQTYGNYLTIGDIDGDGKPDVIVTNPTLNSVSILLNNSTFGHMAFLPKVDFQTGVTPKSVFVSDIDGDDRLDVITSHNGSISILRNISSVGNLAFAPSLNYNIGNYYSDLSITDMDGDSKPDIVTNVGQGVVTLRNISTIGNLAFGSNIFYAHNTGTNIIATGDIDCDGKPDILTPNFTPNSANVYMNTVSIIRNFRTIQPPNITNTPLCAGSNTTIRFSTSGTYNVGNIFTAQLSDALGSFSSPTTIGTLSGTNAGSINITIPSSTGATNGYRIRVISSNPAFIGADNGTDITINPFIYPVSINNPSYNNSTPYICNGQYSLYASTQSPVKLSYLWSNGMNDSSIVVTQPGNYSIVATNIYGCISTASLQIDVSSFSCDGYLVLVTEPIINYFDTIHAKVYMKNGQDIFSTFAYLNYDPSQLKLVSSNMGSFLGNNVLAQPPVVNNGVIDFGMTKLSGDPGSNGNGLVYEFAFVLSNLPSTVAFNATSPNAFFTNFSLTNLNIYNSFGVVPTSFGDISVKNSSTVCRYYVPVWPGDLNNDKKVNVADILPLGYFYGSTGPIRPNGNLSWVGQPAPLWGYDKTNSNSSGWKTFADGNADGIINLADQVSLGFNINKVHARSQNTQPVYLPPSLQPLNVADIPLINVKVADTVVQPAALPLNEVVKITVGSPSAPIYNLYGLAFDLYFDPSYVNTAGITTNYAGSIFGSSGTDFTKIEDRSGLASGRFSVGLTRFNTTNITGSGGTVMNVTFPLLANAPGGYFKVTTLPAGCNDNLGNSLTVGGSSDSLRINSSNPCGTNYWNGTVSSAWENPANWSCGTVPGAVTVVFINANKPNYPVVNSMATCKTLNTSPGVSVKVNPGFNLDILGHN